MKLHELHEAVNSKKSFSENDFPILKQNISKRRLEFFNKSLKKLNTALEEGELIAAEFKSIKENVNRAIEKAHDEVIRAPYFNSGKYKNVDEKERFIGDYYPALHTILGFIKKLNKLKSNSNLVKDARAFYSELAPLATAITNLKDKIVKKKREAVEKEQRNDQKAKTILSHKDVKRVRDVLVKVTEDIRQKLLKANIEWLTGLVDAWEKQYDPSDYRTHHMRRFAHNAYVRTFLSKVLKDENSKMNSPEHKRDNYKEIIKNEAEQITDDTLEQFIVKNTAKMGEIVKNKNNLKDVKLLNADAGKGVVEGRMRLVFDDKSSFDVVNKVVLAYSKYGKAFYRFPTTFHNVKLSDGTKMTNPSEKKMKEEF